MAGNLHTLVRDLQRRKAREKRELVVAEGRRLVEDALGSGLTTRGVIVAEDAQADAAKLAADAEQKGIAVERATRKEFAELADTDTPSGILAVVEWSPASLDTLPHHGSERLLLVLDAVQDPGNVGTMIRTAFALGAWATVALDGTADVRNPKVIRGSMGALFRHPVATATMDELLGWDGTSSRMFVLATMDGQPLRRGEALARPALVIGSEGHGVRDAWDGVLPAPRRVAIPMAKGAESLNAAVAAGILLYEMTR